MGAIFDHINFAGEEPHLFQSTIQIDVESTKYQSMQEPQPQPSNFFLPVTAAKFHLFLKSSALEMTNPQLHSPVTTPSQGSGMISDILPSWAALFCQTIVLIFRREDDALQTHKLLDLALIKHF